MRLLATTALCTLLAAPAPVFAATEAEVMETYADIAAAGFGDALTTAERLQAAVDAFLDAPSAEGLAAAKSARRAARGPYRQTEA